MVKNAIIIGFVLVAAASMLVLLIDTQASVDDNPTLESVRAEVLASGA